MASANEKILDLEVRHQVGLWRYGSGTISRVLKVLNAADEDLVAQISKFDPNAVSGIYSRKRIEAMLEAIRKINKDAYTQFGKQVFGEMEDLAKYEVEFQAALIPEAIGIGWDIVQPSAQQLVAAVMAEPFQGLLLKDWVVGLEAGRYARLKSQIQLGFVEGETTEQIIKRVRGTAALKYADGVLAIGRRSATTMVRTALNHTATASRDLLFEENDDLIKGVQWVSTLDMRTTPICISRDGKVYPLKASKGKPSPRPPAHLNCRSTIIPITKTFKELGIDAKEVPAGTRASMNGQVPAKTTYPEWLKAQTPAVQNEVLGVTKAQLWRDGALPIDRFIDTTGKEYTIAQLRQRERAAFEKAGLIDAEADPGPLDPHHIDIVELYETKSSVEFSKVLSGRYYGAGPIYESHPKFPEFIDRDSNQSLYSYVGSGYMGVNGYLRELTKPGGVVANVTKLVGTTINESQITHFKKQAVELTGLMKAQTNAMVTQRGIKNFEVATGYKLDELHVGQTLDLIGFVSTSREPLVAIDFASSGPRGTNVLLQIRTKSGTQSIITNPGEAEVILPDKSQVVVTKVFDVPKDHYLYMHKGITKVLDAKIVDRDKVLTPP